MYYVGLDLGSSSLKLALVDSQTGQSRALVQVPEEEMTMIASKKGWAEQKPEQWWQFFCEGIEKLLGEAKVLPEAVIGIGIAYQMHGLVLVDALGSVLRNAIIWCDSRAVAIGEEAYHNLGTAYCDTHLLNAPGNFTASKLAWVKQHEPDTFSKIHKIMLPGDYIAFRLSGKATTTLSGLSEGIFWDFKTDTMADSLLEYYGIDPNCIADIVPTFAEQGMVSEEASKACGLLAGTPILYRAGDQPNNALSLNVFNVGEVAATGGTSGVMYAITDSLSVQESARVNNFAHVNYQTDQKHIGKLLCINGAGIQYRWLLNNLSVESYQEMNDLAATVPIGSDGAVILPFGNGAERMLLNKTVGTHMLHIDLNRHTKAHLCRAALEGIAFSFVYGFDMMRADGVAPEVIRAGDDNLFRSVIFSDTIATLIQKPIEIYHTTGAVGAARACAVHEKGQQVFSSFLKEDYVNTFRPNDHSQPYVEAYQHWKIELENSILK